MKQIISILFITLGLYCYGQNDKCIEQKQAAFYDVKMKHYKYIEYHSNWADSTKYRLYRDNHLSKYFGIEKEERLLGYKYNDSCYWQTMDSLFLEKFGEDFLIKENEKIRIEYSNLTKREKSKVLQKDKIYHMVYLDQLAIFEGDISKIREFFIKTYNLDMSEFNNWINVLTIDRRGKIIDYTLDIHNELSFSSTMKQKKRDLKELNKIGKWKSGILWGKKVNSDVFF